MGLFLYWPVSRCAKSKGKVHWQVRGVTSPAGCATMPAWPQKELQHTEHFLLCLSFLIFLIFEDACEEEAGLSAIEHVPAASFAWWHRVAALDKSTRVHPRDALWLAGGQPSESIHLICKCHQFSSLRGPHRLKEHVRMIE